MIAALLILAFTLFSFNSEAGYTVGCYGEDGTRAINGSTETYEQAQDMLDHIVASNPDFDCDIQEMKEQEYEEEQAKED
jgi:hypothetical protein